LARTRAQQPHACHASLAFPPVRARAATAEDTGGPGGLSALLGTEKEWTDSDFTSDADEEEEEEEEEEAEGGAAESGGEGEGPSAALSPQHQHGLPQRLRSPRAPQRPRGTTVSPPARGGDAAVGAAALDDGAALGAALDAGGAAGVVESPADLIARRTRAHVSLVDFDMETLEQDLHLVRAAARASARATTPQRRSKPYSGEASGALRAAPVSCATARPPARPQRACRHTPVAHAPRATRHARARPPAPSARTTTCHSRNNCLLPAKTVHCQHAA
jgi:hypothetical protein